MMVITVLRVMMVVAVMQVYSKWLAVSDFFFFKQKTAYEMRISDWSSDVCSSDLRFRVRGGFMIRQSVIFDVGKVLFDWDLRHLFAKLIDDPAELEWFVGHVVTPEWHFQHDAGRPLAEMVPERKAEFPEHGALIDAYATRFNATIPGPVPGSLDLVARLDAGEIGRASCRERVCPYV